MVEYKILNMVWLLYYVAHNNPLCLSVCLCSSGIFLWWLPAAELAAPHHGHPGLHGHTVLLHIGADGQRLSRSVRILALLVPPLSIQVFVFAITLTMHCIRTVLAMLTLQFIFSCMIFFPYDYVGKTFCHRSQIGLCILLLVKNTDALLV